MNFRLAYLTDGDVNWCEELGTVLANDEIIRMRNNAWRQNNIKLPGIFNNSYLTTPNIPLDKNFSSKFS